MALEATAEEVEPEPAPVPIVDHHKNTKNQKRTKKNKKEKRRKKPGIGAANPDEENYSPMWRISFIEWKDPSQARVLENLNDINRMLQTGLITLTPAMEGRHIVNCPFFDAETISEHQKDSS